MNPETGVGTKDGQGAGDRDQPYRFGEAISIDNAGPFYRMELARLMIFRARQPERHLLRHRCAESEKAA